MKERVHVLMVEDNRGDVVLMQEAIHSLGLPYELTVARDGVEAMDILCRRGSHSGASRPDMIVLDLKLPRKTGMEVLDELKADPILGCIPVIVLSSSISELSVARARNDPPYTCIGKPTTFDGYIEIARTLETFRNGEQGKKKP